MFYERKSLDMEGAGIQRRLILWQHWVQTWLLTHKGAIHHISLTSSPLPKTRHLQGWTVLRTNLKTHKSKYRCWFQMFLQDQRYLGKSELAVPARLKFHAYLRPAVILCGFLIHASGVAVHRQTSTGTHNNFHLPSKPRSSVLSLLAVLANHPPWFPSSWKE